MKSLFEVHYFKSMCWVGVACIPATLVGIYPRRKGKRVNTNGQRENIEKMRNDETTRSMGTTRSGKHVTRLISMLGVLYIG